MSEPKATTAEYLIIGNSAAAIGAVEAIREVDKIKPITMVCEEPYPAYSRPLISKYLAGERNIDGILFRPADFYLQNSIDLLTGVKVKHLDVITKIAYLEGDELISWRRLLLATGGIPIVPKLDGGDKEGVFTFLTLKDAIAISEYLKNGLQAVVIGGGLIGISVAEALTKRGVSVTVVEMKDRILNTILDETASSIAEKVYTKAGVKFITNHTVRKIVGNTRTEGVVLDDGAKIPCHLVVIAIGVQPRVELATAAGIKVNRGIVVDRFMCTSHPDVYAAGDVAEGYDFVFGTNRLTPIWPNAYSGGRIAGLNMAGTKIQYPGGTAMNSLNYFGLDIAAAGVVTPPADKSCEIMSQQTDVAYKKLVLSDDTIIGIVFVGDIERAGIIHGLMRDRINVAGFKQALLADNFGLAYLPAELRQKRLAAATADRK
jgi:NAD(P)H-nitrite reductase large subunit